MNWEPALCPNRMKCGWCGRQLERGDPVWVIYSKCEVVCSRYCARSIDPTGRLM